MSIRVVLVDDHAILRSGLRRVLDAEPDIEVVGEAESADRAVFEALARLSSIVATGASSPANTVVRTHMLSVRRLTLKATTSRSVT